jgi:hypothetical protein
VERMKNILEQTMKPVMHINMYLIVMRKGMKASTMPKHIWIDRMPKTVKSAEN